ncbi:unnamed protein product [Sphagnum troendelagicum]
MRLSTSSQAMPPIQIVKESDDGEKYEVVFRNMRLATANSIRQSLLDGATAEALHYSVIFDMKLDDDICENTIHLMVQYIPAQGPGIYLLSQKVDGKKGDLLNVTSNDLKSMPCPTGLNKVKWQKIVDCKTSDSFRYLVWKKNNNPPVVKSLETKRLSEITEAMLPEKISKAIEMNRGEAFVIYKAAGDDQIDVMITEGGSSLKNDVSLFQMSKSQKVEMVFVTKSGSPTDSAKWSAVTTASSHQSRDDTVTISFSTVVDDADRRSIFVKSLRENIETINSVINLVTEPRR